MSDASNELLTRALSLSAEERLAVATRLLESVEGPLDESWGSTWLQELEKREGEPEAGVDAALAQARDALKAP
jgi:hypothetical protein